jgi:hypothetical protein
MNLVQYEIQQWQIALWCITWINKDFRLDALPLLVTSFFSLQVSVCMNVISYVADMLIPDGLLLVSSRLQISYSPHIELI